MQIWFQQRAQPALSVPEPQRVDVGRAQLTATVQVLGDHRPEQQQHRRDFQQHLPGTGAPDAAEPGEQRHQGHFAKRLRSHAPSASAARPQLPHLHQPADVPGSALPQATLAHEQQHQGGAAVRLCRPAHPERAGLVEEQAGEPGTHVGHRQRPSNGSGPRCSRQFLASLAADVNVRSENPMVCGQNGYHIIQNNQPILLINESNTICTSGSISKEDICPKK